MIYSTICDLFCDLMLLLVHQQVLPLVNLFCSYVSVCICRNIWLKSVFEQLSYWDQVADTVSQNSAAMSAKPVSVAQVIADGRADVKRKHMDWFRARDTYELGKKHAHGLLERPDEQIKRWEQHMNVCKEDYECAKENAKEMVKEAKAEASEFAANWRRIRSELAAKAVKLAKRKAAKAMKVAKAMKAARAMKAANSPE